MNNTGILQKDSFRKLIKVRLENKLGKKPFKDDDRGFAFSHDNGGAVMEVAYEIITDCCEQAELNITEYSADDGFGTDKWSRLAAIGNNISCLITVKYDNGVLEVILI